MGLILHHNDNAVSREELAECPTPRRTFTWQPIPHMELLKRVEAVLPRYSLCIDEQAHGLTHDGNRYFGLLRVRGLQEKDDYARVIGLRNSHDMSFSAGLVAGTTVMVCSNLSFSGEVKVARKHTRNIFFDLPDLVDRAVSQLDVHWHNQDRRIEAYKQKRVSRCHSHDLTVKALDSGVISSQQVPKVLAEWRKPSHDEFAPRNLWSWFNACTEVLKGRVHLLPDRTHRLHSLCDQFSGIGAN